jgi:hypothetical protein
MDTCFAIKTTRNLIRALGALLGLATVEINPVHRDGSTCFNGIDPSTVALAAGAKAARSNRLWY